MEQNGRGKKRNNRVIYRFKIINENNLSINNFTELAHLPQIDSEFHCIYVNIYTY